jgi:predicted enzyme related to lactoylglutathione lyase
MLKTRKFYSELFGWNIEKWTGAESMPEGMEYWTVTAKNHMVMMRLEITTSRLS